jgi:hypothetical protein
MWAFKPTTVIDIRYLPAEEQEHVAKMIAELKGKSKQSTPRSAAMPPESKE